jgi:MFS family permease
VRLTLGGHGASSRVGRYTQRTHLAASVLEGVVLGVFLLNEYVAKKTLGASDVVLTTLVVSTTAALLFSAWWSGNLAGREKGSTFLVFGVLGRLTLLLVALAPGAAGFTAVIAGATFLFGAIVPASNALLQRNYTVLERGRVAGLGLAIQALATIATSLVVGRIYDARPGAYRAVYAVAGLVGFVSCLRYAALRYRSRPGEPREAPLFRRELGRTLLRSLRSPFGGAVAILREDRGFRRYEAAYMSYGLAWMMLQPVIPVFLVERLHVAYGQVAAARGLIYFSAIALLSPLLGRLLDRLGPLRISRYAFLTLILFPLLLASARDVPTVFLAFLVFGTGMAGINLGWTMGPIHFAGSRDSAAYMGAHVALVGVRSLIGGPFGIWLYRASGSPLATFAAASLLFALAAAIIPSGRPARARAA